MSCNPGLFHYTRSEKTSQIRNPKDKGNAFGFSFIGTPQVKRPETLDHKGGEIMAAKKPAKKKKAAKKAKKG